MGKVASSLGAAVLLVLVACLPPLPEAARAQTGSPVPCSDQPLIAPMQGHYTGPWHSDGEYHFYAFNTDIDLKIIIDGTLDATVSDSGQVSGTATGNVNAPITHDGKQDVSSGIGSISGRVTGTFSPTGATLTLSAPVIDMHWGTFGGHAAERFITMPDYQLPVGGLDCVSAQGTIAEQDFPVQTIVPDGLSLNPVQVPGTGTAGGTWSLASDQTAAYQGLSQQVDSFIASANSVLGDPATRLTPSLVDRRIVQPLKALQAAIRQNPDVSRCLLERLAAWELSALPPLFGRAQQLAGSTDMVGLRAAGDLIRSAALLNLDCAVPDGGATATLLDVERQRLDRAIASRAWPEMALLLREILLLGGNGERGSVQQQVQGDIRGLLQGGDRNALLDLARLAYALGDSDDAAAAVKTLSSGFARSIRPAKHKKPKKKGQVVKPTPQPTATPVAPPKTLEEILMTGAVAMTAEAAAGVSPALTWQPVSGAARYLVVVTPDGTGPILWAWSGPGVSVTYGDTALAGAGDTADDGWPIQLTGASYRWSVIAMNDAGQIVGLRLRTKLQL